jgi:hypothetical protein
MTNRTRNLNKTQSLLNWVTFSVLSDEPTPKKTKRTQTNRRRRVIPDSNPGYSATLLDCQKTKQSQT